MKSKKAPGVRYASVFWRKREVPEPDTVSAMIGWSMPDERDYGYVSGAVPLSADVKVLRDAKANVLPIVEEAVGVVHPKPNRRQQEQDEHHERLVADYLLFLMHRAVFGQCRQFFHEYINNDAIADAILYFGPLLPKFVGRICYSHFTRDKTLAVLAPECGLGDKPVCATGNWRAEPQPSFWYDCAVRQWDAEPTGEQPARLNSFSLIVPTGDGISGKIRDGLAVGASMWRKKAEAIQAIVDGDRQCVRYAMWDNAKIYVPTGMAKAIRAAVLNERLEQARADLKALEENPQHNKVLLNTATSILKQRFTELRDQHEAEGLRALLTLRTLDVGRLQSPTKEAKSGHRSPEQVTKLIDTAEREIGASLGESVFDVDGI